MNRVLFLVFILIHFATFGQDLTECSCADGTTANIVADFCFVPVGGCADPNATNYCYPGDLSPVFNSPDCQYEGDVLGCMCPDAINYNCSSSDNPFSTTPCSDGVTVEDGSCIITNGGCSDPLAYNYSGEECETGQFLFEDCQYQGCMCPDADNYDLDATIAGACWVFNGGCADATATNYSGDECALATFLNPDCQYTPVDVDLTWEEPITDANMTIQISPDVVTFNNTSPPVGSLLGAFFTNDNNELICAGYDEWTGDQLAMALWASESGLDNGFATGEEFTWALQIGNNDYLASSVEMNTAGIFTDVFAPNGLGQILSATFEGEAVPGCMDETAFNYNPDANIEDNSCYMLDFNFSITDANMSIQVSQSAISFNDGEPPCGAKIGAFYTNDSGQLACGGYKIWCDDFSNNQLAIPLWASESGLDNGFAAGEEITWILSINNQNFVADSILMNPNAPFSSVFAASGLGQILTGEFNGEFNEVLGCTDEDYDNYNSNATQDDGSCYIAGCTIEEACNYDANATIDNDSCLYATVWYWDSDGDGLGDPNGFSQPACIDPSGDFGDFADNDNDECPNDPQNDANENGICDDEEVFGCTNISADNYNEDANVDDGSCIVSGCTDPSAFGYDSSANTDDGSCCYVSGCNDATALNYNSDLNVCYDDGSCCYIGGCTDQTALNYNSDLNVCYDDGSCIAEVLGCTDPNAFGYNPDANTDDGSCEDYVYGCTDNQACNYDNSANTSDGSCDYATTYYDCNDVCLNDADSDGVCNELEIFGCTDETAYNYDVTATEDNNSCIAEVLGCTDPNAFGYNPDANTDDGTCCYIGGCTDPTAWNYNSGINACYDDGSCIAEVLGCTDPNAFGYNPDANTDDGSCADFVYGCTDDQACNYDNSANSDDGFCTYAADFYDCNNVCLDDADDDGVCDQLETGGCIDSTPGIYPDIYGNFSLDNTGYAALNYDPNATDDNGFCLYSGCLDILACNYDLEGFYNEIVICDYESCAGCTDANATNYDSEATIDDGSCQITGCTELTACNYDANANTDDGSCYNNDLGCGCDNPAAIVGYDCDNNCLNDTDGDGICDEFEVLGCTDETACNYNLSATDDDGSCYNNDLGCGCDNPAAAFGYDCDNNCLNDTDGDGICDEFEVLGCTDESACNYNLAATDGDGTCEYPLDGFDCDGNQIALDSPWGNNTCISGDLFTSHIVTFDISEGINIGDFIGLFYTSENGDLVFAQAIEYDGSNFYFAICGDDSTTNEKDGFSIGEEFIWQLWPVGENCAYSLNLTYTGSDQTGYYQPNGMSQVSSLSGGVLSVATSITDNLCGSQGSVELSVIGGTPPYTFTENGIDFYEMVDNPAQLFIDGGSYVFTISDDNGCVSEVSFDVTAPGEIESEVTITNPLCAGSQGAVVLSVDGGTPPYTYTENGIDFYEMVDNPAQLFMDVGSYVFTISDDNGCVSEVSFDVTAPGEIESEVTITNPLCAGSQGAVVLSVDGGTPPYTYTENGIDFYEMIDNPAQLFMDGGSYVFTISDDNGCVSEVSFDVNVPDLLEVTDNVIAPLCDGDDGSVELLVTGGTPPYSFTENGIDFYEMVDNPAQLFMDGGSYVFTVSDDNGCVSEVIFDVIEPDPVNVIPTTESVSCNGGNDGSASFNITGGTGDYDSVVQYEVEINQSLENNFSMSLDGSSSDYINLGSFCSYDLCSASSSFSMNLKVQVDQFGWSDDGSLIESVILGTTDVDGTWNGFNLYVNPEGQFIFNVGGNGTTSAVVSNPKEEGVWYDITIVLDQSLDLILLYIDGVLEGSSSIASIGTVSNNYELFLGGNVLYNTAYFSGLVDNLSIWSTALDQPQISDLECINGSENNLQAFYNFESVGNTAGNPSAISINDVTGNFSNSFALGYYYVEEAPNANCINSELVVVNDLDNLSAGNYTITTFDDNGCSNITLFSILEPAELSLTFAVSSGEFEFDNNCSSGSATAIVEGGTGEYEYLWSNGSTSSEISGVCGGEYQVMVTDANDCMVMESVFIDYLIPEGWDLGPGTDLLSHSIDIPSNAVLTLDGFDLTPGDYLGVFNDNGNCGGYVMWTGDSTELVAYESFLYFDEVTGLELLSNSGFIQWQQFNWRVWDVETETEAHGFAVYDESYPDNRLFILDGESGISNAVFVTSQTIQLNENPYSNWDVISTYISNEDSVQSILAPIVNELVIIKDGNALVYWPQLDINSLTFLNNTDAYAIKTWASNELIIYGDFVQPENISFDLFAGWNYISYPRYYSSSIGFVLSDIETYTTNSGNNNIKLLKDDSGNIYWPELNINTINNMEAGEGYLLNLLEDQEFQYPANGLTEDFTNDSNEEGRLGSFSTIYYSHNQTTNNNMIIGLPEYAWLDFNIQYGDELAVLDSEGNIVGVTVLCEENNSIVVWGNDDSSLNKDGMFVGEELVFELWDMSSNTVLDLEFEWLEGGDTYLVNGINIASVIRVEEKHDNLEYVNCYPNPSSGNFTLDFYINKENNVNVAIFNSIGKKVYDLDDKLYTKGLHSVPISLSHLVQGLYYIEVNSHQQSQTIILDLTK